MKKLFFLLSCCFCFFGVTISQVIPKGMNYQAVARDAKGGLLKDENIMLQITLFSNEGGQRVDYYTESHSAKTSEIGLFNLVVGEGIKDFGQYALIPWNTENIWMQVALKDKKTSGLTMVSNSKLLAVPYAIYAGTANKLVGPPGTTVSDFAPPEPGVVSNDWSVFGNAKTDAAGNPYRVNSLGTTDLVDLIMITDNIERLRILATGDIITKLNFEIGKDLTVVGNAAIQQTLMIGDSLIVKKNVLFNVEGGNTINYGPFNVIHQSPTWLTGTLIVDKATLLNDTLTVQGPTNLNSRLFVNNMSPTHLTGTLQVDKITDLNDSLSVNNMSPTHLTGRLTVDKATVLNDSFTVNNMSPSYLTGTLTVAKSTNLNDSLTVDDMGPTALTGTLTVVKDVVFNNKVLLTDTTQSLDTISGALIVTGGIGLGRNLNVGGSSTFGGPVSFASPVTISDETNSNDPGSGALVVNGGAGIAKNLNVGGTTVIAGMTTFADTTQSNSTTTGALKVTGGTGIIRNLNVGGTASIAGMTSITNTSASANATSGALVVTGGMGIVKELNVAGITSILDGSPSASVTDGALKIVGGLGIRRQLNVGGIATISDPTQSTNLTTGALKILYGGVGISKQLNVGGMTSILDVTPSAGFGPLSGALKVSGGAGIGMNVNVGLTLGVNKTTNFKNGLTLFKGLFVNSNNPYIATFRNTNGANNGISIQIASSSPKRINNYVEFRNNSGGVIGRIEGEDQSEYKNNPRYTSELTILSHDVTFAEIGIATAITYTVAAAAELVAAATSSTPCVGFGGCGTLPILSLIVKAGIEVASRAVGVAIAEERLTTANATKSAFISYKDTHVGVSYESGNGDYAEWLPKADTAETFLPGYIVGLTDGQITKKINSSSRPLVISSNPIILGNMPGSGDQHHFEKVAFLGQVPVLVSGRVHTGDYILPSGFDDGIGKAVSSSMMQAEDYSRIVGVAWSSSNDDAYQLVNVAIGLNETDGNMVVVKNQKDINRLKSKFNQSDLILNNLLPGYKSGSQLLVEEVDKNLVSSIDFNNEPSFISNIEHVSQSFFPLQKSSSGSVDVTEVSREQVIEVLNLVEQNIEARGASKDLYPIWSLSKTDAASREFIIKSIQGVYKKSVQFQLDKRKLRQ